MADYTYKYYNITFPQQYVAHVEINRADKMNAFFEAYAPSPSPNSSDITVC